MCKILFCPLQVRDVEAVVKRFKTDLHNCVGYIQDPKMLKESIKALYQKHVQEDIVSIHFSLHQENVPLAVSKQTRLICAHRREYSLFTL